MRLQKNSRAALALQHIFYGVSAIVEKRIGLISISILSMLLIFSAMGRIAFAGQYDVGVIPGPQGCPPGLERIEIHMDDQDDGGWLGVDNANGHGGWIGATVSTDNTTFVFCRVDGTKFRSLPYPGPGNQAGKEYIASKHIANTYAVLKLANDCPPGSYTFWRYFDNENDDTGNSSSGNISPNVSQRGDNGDTKLYFCHFSPTMFTMVGMTSFPELGFEYGVFAPSNFSKQLAHGYIEADNEDSSSPWPWDVNNTEAGYSEELDQHLLSKYKIPLGDIFETMIYGFSITTLEMAKVHNKSTLQAMFQTSSTIICKGSTATLTFSAKGGVAPFKVKYNAIAGGITSPSEVMFGQDGQGVGEADSPLTYSATIAPNLPTTYRLVSVTDKVGNVSNIMGEVTVNVDTPPEITFTPPAKQCSNGSPVELTGGSPAGGVYSGTGVEFSNGKYYFNPAKASAGNNTITYTATQGSCTPPPKDGTVLVNKSPVVTLALDSNMQFTGGVYTKYLYGTGLPYQLPDPLNAINGGNFTWSPSVANAGGDYTVTYTDDNSCSGTATLHLEVESATSVKDGAMYCLSGKPNNEAYTWKLYGMVFGGTQTLLTSAKVQESGVLNSEGTTGLVNRFKTNISLQTGMSVIIDSIDETDNGYQGEGCFIISDNDGNDPYYGDFQLWVGDSEPTCQVTDDPGCAYNPIIWKVKRHGNCTFVPQIASRYSFETGNEGYINTPILTTGKVGNALSFNGLNRVESPSSPELNVGQSDFSLIAWVKTQQFNGTILSKENNQFGYRLYLSSGQPILRLSTGTGSSSCGNTASNSCTNYNSGKTINDGQWHLVAVTIDRDNPNGGKFYVDGAEVLTFDPTLRAGSLDNDGLFKMGQFTGELDEVAVFKRALRDKEIQNIHKADTDGICKIDMTPPITLCPNSVCNVAKTGSDTAGDGSETKPFATIQHGIDVAKEGYTVLVQAGTYLENIRFGNKNIIVKSKEGAAKTVIDGHQTESVATFIHDGDIAAGVSATLQGFTLTNGIGTPGNDDTYRTDFYAGSRLGGGVLCHKTKPIFKDLIITQNTAKNGGGIFGRGCEPTVINTVISKNTASADGGGVGFVSGWLKRPTFKNVLITENTAAGNGGGVFVNYTSQAVMINSTISKNTSGYGRGGAIDRANQSGVNLTNSIVWDNGANPVYWRGGTGYTSQISYSIVQAGQSASQITWGTGSLDTDPLFVGNGDYHLSASSPALGKGTLSGAPADDLQGNSRPYPAGSAPDMGAYEDIPVRKGMTFEKTQHITQFSQFEIDEVRCNQPSCNPYEGDTACTTKLPILCIKKENLANPGLSTDYYHGWSGGRIGLTQPVAGNELTGIQDAAQRCEAELGYGYRMAEIHDGNGGWGFYGVGNIGSSSRFWTYVNDQNANCWGAGPGTQLPVASIVGIIWLDQNANGVQDVGEGVSGKTVVCAGGSPISTKSATTDTNGQYTLSNLSPGQYSCYVSSIDSGWKIVFPATNSPMTLQAGEQKTADFGAQNQAIRSITGTVFEDLNGNCIKDAGESGLSMQLVSAKLNQLDPLVEWTDSNGNYTFADMVWAGNYTVSLQLDNGYAQTCPTLPAYYELKPPYPNIGVKNVNFGVVKLRSLTVSKTGNGQVSGGGSYPVGTTVNLTATPDSGYTFKGWSPSPCAESFIMPANNLACTATFEPVLYTLNLTKTGEGTGTVISDPNGISCPSDCTEGFPYNTNVTLKALPDSGSVFQGWSGAEGCSGINPTITLNMNASKSCTATFIADLTGCNATMLASKLSACNYSYIDCITADDPDEAACDAAKKACHTEAQTRYGLCYQLSISTEGTGKGTVQSVGGLGIPISCGSKCESKFAYEDQVTLTATADSDSEFSGWFGDCGNSNTMTTTITMDWAKTCKATFSSKTVAGIMGDVDGKNGVDLADAILALQVLAGIDTPNVNAGADVNGDGKIGIEELIYILQKTAGLR